MEVPDLEQLRREAAVEVASLQQRPGKTQVVGTGRLMMLQTSLPVLYISISKSGSLSNLCA
jgi:hypothetical protein